MSDKICARFRCLVLAVKTAPLFAVEMQLVGEPVVLAVKNIQFTGLKSAHIGLQVTKYMLSVMGVSV